MERLPTAGGPPGGWRVLAFALLPAVLSCATESTGPGPAVPASVQVVPSAPVVAAGDAIPLQLVLLDRSGVAMGDLRALLPVYWTSSAPDVATVDGSGRVGALTRGASEITATVAGVTGVAALTVRAPLGALRIRPDRPEVEAVVGDPVPGEVAAVVLDADGRPAPEVIVRFAASPGHGSVDRAAGVTDAYGRTGTSWTLGPVAGGQLLTMAVEGYANLSAERTPPARNTLGGPSAEVHATARAGPALEMSVSPREATLSVGEHLLLAASALDRHGNPVPEDLIRWSASDSAVATVDSGGGVVALSPGTSLITAAAGSASASATVGVTSGAPAGLDIVGGDAQVGPVANLLGEPLMVRVTDSVGYAVAGVLVSWAAAGDAGSLSPAVSPTDEEGLAVAEWTLGPRAGEAMAWATAEWGASVRFTATATPGPVETVSLHPSSALLEVGDELALTARGRDVHGNLVAAASFAWSSDSPHVASVSASGRVTAVARGTAAVTASDGARSGTSRVTVTGPPAVQFECDAPQAGWIWCDDFETDRLGSYFEVSNSEGSFTREAGIGLDASTGMRARWETGQVGAGNLKLAFGRTPSSYMRPVDGGTEDYREVYWRLYVNNERSWVGGGADKLSRAMVLATPEWAQAMIAHVWSSGPENEHLAVDPASGTDELGNLKTIKYNDFDNLRWLGLDRSDTPIFDTNHVGAWYCVEAHVRLNDPGSANGIFELWIDGSPEAQRTGLNWVGGYDAYGINAVFFENFWNAGAPAVQERYVDNIVVSTQRIGCL